MKKEGLTHISDLVVGDTVVLDTMIDSPYGACTVKQIRDGWVTFFRPYVHTDDFIYTGGVICYVGIEEWKAPRDHGGLYYKVLSSSNLDD